MASFANPFLSERSFIVVWPGDDVCEFRVGGEDIVVPPANEVAIGGRYRFAPATLNGRPVPGTIVLKDSFRHRPGEEAVKEFDAEQYLRILHSINPKLISRGLKVVSDPSNIEAARAEGRPAWEAAQAEADQDEINLEFERQRKYAEKYPGVPVPAASNQESVKAAIERNKRRALSNRAAFTQADLIEALGGAPAPAKPAPVVETGHSLEDIAEKLFEASETHKITLSKDQLKGLVKKDAKAMEEVRAKLEAAGVSL